MNPILRPHLALLLALLSLGAPAQDFEKKKARLVDPMVKKLAELALWCRDEQLGHARHDLCSIVVAYDPDHAVCREELGFERGADGQWKERYKKVPPKFTPSDHDEELFARRLKIIRPFKKGMVELLERAQDLAPERRRDELERLSRIDDGASWIAPSLDAARLGGRKVLPETAVSELRSDILRMLGETLVETVPAPEPVEPGEGEDFGFRWTGAVRNREVRVLGTGEKDEAARAARYAMAAGDLFRHLTRSRRPQRDGFQVWLLARPAEKQAIIDHHPLMTPELRVTAVPNPGFWLGQLAVEYGDLPEQRYDGAVRHTLSLYLADHWSIGHPQGWAYEGLGVYLTWLITGNRLRWLIAPAGARGDDAATRDRVKKANARWFSMIRRTFQSGEFLTAGSLMAKNVKDMGPSEVLQAYAMTAYFIECFPTRFTEIIADSGKQVPIRDILLRHLGFELREFERRYVRWVKEQPKSRQ